MTSVPMRRSPARPLVLISLLLLSACIGMKRQRIVTYSDPGRDRFELLLFSEGVFRSDSNRIDENRAKRFVAGDGFVLGGWPFQFDKAVFVEAARKPKRPEYGKVMKLIASSFRTIHLGHYRDHDGAISVAQRVIITNVSELVRELNAVATAFLRNEIAPDNNFLAELPRTRAAIIAAADIEFEWLTIDGNSLIFQFPVDPKEWPKLRSHLMKDLKRTPISFAIKSKEGLLAKGRNPGALLFEELLSDEVPHVRVRLGTPRGAEVLRYYSDETYRKNLEATIEKLIPDKWDVALADAMLAHGIGRHTRATTGDRELWPLLARIPIEDRVRALLRAVDRDGVSRATVAKLLAQLAARWNDGEGRPEAPIADPDAKLDDAALKRWWRWYAHVCAPATG